MISQHETEFAGKRIQPYDGQSRIENPEETAYHFSIDYDAHEDGATFPDLFARFLGDPLARHATALVVGDWGGAGMGNASEPVVEALVAARDKLPKLTALFIGEMISEESEISWIHLSDLSPLWNAYPQLEHFRVRGGEGLSLGTLKLACLKSLVIESGGLAGEVVREVGAAELRELQQLELWLGDDGYGATTRPEDLVPILSGQKFPKLRYLGLRDSCIADEVAAAVAIAPVMQRITTLDLSLGTLTDEGAKALLASPYLGRLSLLDIHHHYVSEALSDQLRKTGVLLNADDRREPDEYRGEIHRYVSVAE
jgi:hypothetical protein